LAHPLTSPCLGCKLKAKVATLEIIDSKYNMETMETKFGC
jgi:hypothetical protein